MDLLGLAERLRELRLADSQGSLMTRPSSVMAPLGRVATMGMMRWPMPPMQARKWGRSGSEGMSTAGLTRPQRPWFTSSEQKIGTSVSGAIV